MPHGHWFHHASSLSASKLVPASLVVITPDVIADYLVAPCEWLHRLDSALIIYSWWASILLHQEHEWHGQVRIEIHLHSRLELVVVIGLKQTNKELFTVAQEMAVYSVRPMYTYVQRVADYLLEMEWGLVTSSMPSCRHEYPVCWWPAK